MPTGVWGFEIDQSMNSIPYHTLTYHSIGSRSSVSVSAGCDADADAEADGADDDDERIF